MFLDWHGHRENSHCQEVSQQNKSPPINYTELPTQPWQHTSAGFSGPTPDRKKLLVIIDYLSCYPLVEIITTTATANSVNKLNQIFAICGFPNYMLTDNGLPLEQLGSTTLHHQKCSSTDRQVDSFQTSKNKMNNHCFTIKFN